MRLGIVLGGMVAAVYAWAEVPSLNALFFANEVRWARVKIAPAKIRLEAARIEADQAVRDFNRTRKLFQKNAESEEVYRSALLARDSTRLRVDESAYLVRALELELELHELSYAFAVGTPENAPEVARLQLEQWKNQQGIATVREKIGSQRVGYLRWVTARYSELLKTGAMPKARWERARADLAKAQAERLEAKKLKESLESVVEDAQRKLEMLSASS